MCIRDRMWDQSRKTHTDQPLYRGAGGADQRIKFRMVTDVIPGKLGDDLSAGTYLKHIIKSAQDQCRQDDIRIFDVIKLTVQGRGRKGNRIFVIS